MALVLYVALLPLWWVALDGLSAVTATVADLIYHLFDPHVSISPGGKSVKVIASTAVGVLGLGAQSNSSTLELDRITYGMPMFAALAIVTRAGSVRAKLRGLALGLVAMTLLTIVAEIVWAKITTVYLDEQTAQMAWSVGGARSNFLNQVFHGYAFSQPVVAVAVWFALVAAGAFKHKDSPNKPAAEPAAATARNSPCPCGSGRKFKRCCGRA